MTIVMYFKQKAHLLSPAPQNHSHKVLDPASSVRRQGAENRLAAPLQSHFSYKLMHRFLKTETVWAA